MEVEKLRRDFPVLRRRIHSHPLIYFDNAATSQKPRVVIEAIKNYYENHNANIHRGVHTLGDESTRAYELAREKVQKFINARKKSEIIFVRNTTEAINLVAKTWGGQNICSKSDTILTTEMEHHSNIIPWMRLVGKRETENESGLDVVLGSDLQFVGVTENGELDLNDLETKLKSPSPPKLLTLTHVSNVLGTVNPVKKIIKLARRASPQIKILLDGAQSMPHGPVDVQSLDCDFLAFSGHKMLGPMGIGVLYVKEEVLKTMPPFLTGGDMIRQVHFEEVEWNDLPFKFEAGTPNVAGAVGLSAAIDYLQEVGMSKIQAHEQELTRYLLEQFQFSSLQPPPSSLQVLGPKDPLKRTGLVAFSIPGIAPHDLAAFLDAQGIAVRSGFHCAQPLHEKFGFSRGSVRASFYLYNTFEEIDQFIKALKRAIEVLA